ncbi:MAG: ankyrin repeat domain-containing protein, partial [Alphaproteobacteria bacterium]
MLGEKQPFENFIKPFNNESSDAQIAGGVEKTEGSAFGLLTAKKEDDKTYLEWLIEKSYHQTLSALIYKGAFVDGDNEINLNEGFAQSPLLRASKIFASDPTNADAKAMLQILLYGGIETVLGSARYNVYKKAERAAGAVTSVIAAADGFTSGALTSAAEAVSNSAGTAWEWAKEMVSQLKQLEDVETDASQIGEAGTASEVQDALISKPSDRIFKEENRAFVVLADGSLEIVTNILKAGDADLVAKVLLWYGKPYNQAQFKDGQKDLAEAALVEAIAANKDADAVIKFVTDYAAQAKKSEVDVLKLVCIKEIDDKVKDKVIGYFYHKNIGDKKSHSLKSVIDVIAAQERNEKVTSFKAVKTTIAKEIEAAFSPNRKRVVAEGAMVEGLQQSMIGGQAIEDLSNSTIDRAGYKLVLRDVDLQKKWDTHTEKYSVSTIARVADNEKRTMLHAAVSLGEVELVETLVKNFADINAVDKAGQTPMQYAINLVTSAANDKKSEAYKDAVAIAKLLILGRGADTMNILTSGVLFYGAQYRSPIDTARFSKNKREGYVDATALNELLSVLEPQDLALILQYLAANQPHILFSGALKNGFSEAVEGQTEIGLVIRRNATLAASNLEVQMTGLADELRAKLELGNLPNSVKELEKLEKEIKDLYAEKYDILADVVSNDGPN